MIRYDLISNGFQTILITCTIETARICDLKCGLAILLYELNKKYNYYIYTFNHIL